MNLKFLTILLLIFLMQNNSLAEQNMINRENNSRTIQLSVRDSLKNDSWFGRDKGLHLIGSLIGTTLISNINKNAFGMNNSNSKTVGAGVVISLGFIKETLDSRQIKNRFSWKDLLADFAGVLLGLAILEID